MNMIYNKYRQKENRFIQNVRIFDGKENEKSRR